MTVEFPSIDLVATGKKIHNLRENSGYTVSEIAEFMGFNADYSVYKWMSGKCLPSLDNLVALSRLFGVSMDEIIICKDQKDCRKESESSPFVRLIGNRYEHYAS